MKSLQLLLKGAKRSKGAARGKLPITVEVLEVIYEILDVDNNIDRNIL